MKLTEWSETIGEVGHFGEWARSQLDRLGADEIAFFGRGDDYEGQELWIATSIGLYTATLEKTADKSYAKHAELRPWSHVRQAFLAFAGFSNAPSGWQVTVRIDEPAFSETRADDHRQGKALLEFGHECMMRSEAARTRQ